jgi:hypothetical protein
MINPEGKLMRVTNELQAKTVNDAVQEACSRAATRRGLDPTEGWGYVCATILDRLDRIAQLQQPLEHYVRFTATREAYRFFRGKAKWGHQQKED